MIKKLFLLLAFMLLVFTGCDLQTDTETNEPQAIRGIYVLNEGAYGTDNASLTYYNFATGATNLDVYKSVNNKKLGSLGNHMDFFKTSAYIVLSSSNLIEIASLEDMKSLKSIKVNNPREIAIQDENIAYVSSYTNQVYKLNLKTFAVVDSVKCGANPEGLTIVNDRLFVINSGWGNDNTVTAIDTKTFKSIKTITVGQNPQDILRGIGNEVIVICADNYFDQKGTGGVYKIDTDNLVVTKSLKVTNFPSSACGFEPSQMLLANNDGVYVIDAVEMKNLGLLLKKADVMPGAGEWSNIYSIAYNPYTKEIYCGNPKDYTQNGEIVVFDNNGTKLGQFSTGVIPGTIKVIY